jgi:hypothetical protein
MKFKVVFLVLMLIWMVSHKCHAADSSVKNPSADEIAQEKLLQSLVSTNREVRLASAVALDTQRKQLVQKLMGILDSTNSERVKVDAVIVLGEYRASEAAPILAHHLEWDDIRSGRGFNGLMSREADMERGAAVTLALCNIGLPAFNALLDRIAETDDAKTIAKCILICQYIEGPDAPEAAQFRLQRRLDKETDQSKKARFQSAMEVLKKPNPTR